MIRRAVCAGTVAGVLAATVVPAPGQDVNAMAKWTAATVVHYRVVGEFTGKWTILKGKTYLRDAEISDRVELEFDWDQTASKLVRPAVIKNLPTKLGAIDPARFATMKGQCPPPRIDSRPEYVTVVAVSPLSSVLQLEMTRTMAGGALPGNGEQATSRCGEVWDPAAPAATTVKEGLTVPPAMALAMPSGAAGMKVTPDGKSLVIQTKGWTWTYTPTIVK